MKRKFKIWDALWFLVPVLMVALSSAISKDLVCEDVVIKLDNFHENQFIKEDELLMEVEEELSKSLAGSKLIHNDLSVVENHLKNNKFVKRAQVMSDHKGQLIIDVLQERPMARIVTNNESFYLSESGTIMPTSKNYSSRVMVVTGAKTIEILKNDTSSASTKRDSLVKLIRNIHQDKFLKAQVASFDVDEKEKLTIYPQVTKQTIMFGSCENLVDKLWRLKLFYKQVLPRKGWNDYSKVNLEFKNQIICE